MAKLQGRGMEDKLGVAASRNAAIHQVHDALRKRSRDCCVNRIASRHQDAGSNLDNIGLLGNHNCLAHFPVNSNPQEFLAANHCQLC